MPNVDAANISYNLLRIAAGNGITVGGILLGAARPVHILTPSSTVRRIVNMTALARGRRATAERVAAHAIDCTAMNDFVARHGPQRGSAKTARIPIKCRGRARRCQSRTGSACGSRRARRFREVKQVLREAGLHTVCEEASCPNIGECFGKGTATFMVLGDLCTRRCPFCDVAHGRPQPPDPQEPQHLARHGGAAAA